MATLWLTYRVFELIQSVELSWSVSGWLQSEVFG